MTPKKVPIRYTEGDLKIALRESLALQSHYAFLLNSLDGGRRMVFRNNIQWIARLQETGVLPKRRGR